MKIEDNRSRTTGVRGGPVPEEADRKLESDGTGSGSVLGPCVKDSRCVGRPGLEPRSDRTSSGPADPGESPLRMVIVVIDQRRKNLGGLGEVEVGQRTRMEGKRRGDTKHEMVDVRRSELLESRK